MFLLWCVALSLVGSSIAAPLTIPVAVSPQSAPQIVIIPQELPQLPQPGYVLYLGGKGVKNGQDVIVSTSSMPKLPVLLSGQRTIPSSLPLPLPSWLQWPGSIPPPSWTLSNEYLQSLLSGSLRPPAIAVPAEESPKPDLSSRQGEEAESPELPSLPKDIPAPPTLPPLDPSILESFKVNKLSAQPESEPESSEPPKQNEPPKEEEEPKQNEPPKDEESKQNEPLKDEEPKQNEPPKEEEEELKQNESSKEEEDTKQNESPKEDDEPKESEPAKQNKPSEHEPLPAMPEPPSLPPIDTGFLLLHGVPIGSLLRDEAPQGTPVEANNAAEPPAPVASSGDEASKPENVVIQFEVPNNAAFSSWIQYWQALQKLQSSLPSLPSLSSLPTSFSLPSWIPAWPSSIPLPSWPSSFSIPSISSLGLPSIPSFQLPTIITPSQGSKSQMVYVVK